jgi:hypothetical protein
MGSQWNVSREDKETRKARQDGDRGSMVSGVHEESIQTASNPYRIGDIGNWENICKGSDQLLLG